MLAVDPVEGKAANMLGQGTMRYKGIARCWVQKVSKLILNINVEVRSVATGETVCVKSVDIRGNTDETWLRGVRRPVDNIQERNHHLR